LSPSPSILNQRAFASREALAASYDAIRQVSEAICKPLAIEDYVVQPAAHVSPPKWHLAHTTWFFERFVLLEYCRGYEQLDPTYSFLFNSYYETVGGFFPRELRGTLSRPTVEEIYGYRAHVDEHMRELIASCAEDIAPRVVLGLNHEQQHQELLLMDIKAIFAMNPLKPAYREFPARPPTQQQPLNWLGYAGGLQMIGADGAGFRFDNETPRHRVFLQPFRLASRLVTNREYLSFIDDRGYARPELWLSDGWRTVQTRGWRAPLYWEKVDNDWWTMTLSGFSPIQELEPVCHLGFYEADAYARWAGKRLPSESEWETATAHESVEGNFYDSWYLYPLPAREGCRQFFGDVWEWTQSAYAPYPGFKPLAGSLGEYNGKFMCNQMVLRGGSCVTSLSHIRPSYRNFFYPEDRWQFAGIRLADSDPG
jgi:ergothioneine biosynthesis protein EgtB